MGEAVPSGAVGSGVAGELWSPPPGTAVAGTASAVVDRETLYTEFQPLIRRLLRQYGEDAELRQDLPGEIFCRFCALYEAYDPSLGVPLRPYLVRGLTASVYTFARSQWRRQRREICLDPTLEIRTRTGPSDPTQGWDRQLACQGILRDLPQAISALPPRQRQVVVGRFYEGRSFEELAETLGVRVTTARSLLRHGINNLRRQLAIADLGFG